ncbi:HlyD family efflux transporter periplasmic adaptor subunit, partial [Pseudomonas sp. NPDC090755]|uniref:HlyD family efflux transporter periplasmic adaptor subunit n=1 Tax=Pseudomonas sp. NPDC090755 TaxID=3364481 RepID=UPI00383B1FC0
MFGRRKNSVAPYIHDLQAALITSRHPLSGFMVVFALVIMLVFYVWAANSELEEVTVASGVIIPMGREQVIQSLDAGVLKELYVKEGDIVQKGQKLLRIDDTRSGALLQEFENKGLALKASKARLLAELNGTTPDFPPEVASRPELVMGEMAAYKSRKEALESAEENFRKTLSLLGSEIAITEPLTKKGVISVVELLRLKRQQAETLQQLDERRNKFKVEVTAELTRVESDLSQALEAAKARADTVDNAVVTSPVRGTIKNVELVTIGGVVQAGQPLMQIVPIGDQLLVEGFVKPSDVAYLRPGLRATVKLSAYNYTTYGSLKGELTLVSPDTLRDDRRSKDPNKPDEGYYRILVRTDEAELVRGENHLPVIPGMTGTIEVKTGTHTIWEYLTTPISRVSEA